MTSAYLTRFLVTDTYTGLTLHQIYEGVSPERTLDQRRN